MAATAVAVSALTGLTGDTVTVPINEFRDPQGLERRLRAEGIPTIVDYIPPGKACSRDGRIWFDGGSGFGKPSPGHNDTRFQIRRSDVGAGQALSIFAVTVAGQHDPAVFTFDMVPASTPDCDLIDATLPTTRPGPSPSSNRSSTNSDTRTRLVTDAAEIRQLSCHATEHLIRGCLTGRWRPAPRFPAAPGRRSGSADVEGAGMWVSR